MFPGTIAFLRQQALKRQQKKEEEAAEEVSHEEYEAFQRVNAGKDAPKMKKKPLR